LGAVTNAGFEAVAIADSLGSLSLATLSPATTARIGEILDREGLQGVVAANNPLDLTPNCTAAGYADAVEAVLADPGVDVGLIGCVPLTPSLDTLAPGDGHDEDVTAPSSLASRLVALWGSTGKPWVAVIDAGSPYDTMARMLEEGGIPTFRSADRALHMLGRWRGGTAG
jgi:acyl-CoA synthetase (NDP forming)